MVLFPSRAGMNPVQKDYDLADDPVPLTRGDEPFEDISTAGADCMTWAFRQKAARIAGAENIGVESKGF